MHFNKIVFSKEQARDIISLFKKERQTTGAIGEKYGVTCNTIINFLRENNVEVNLSAIRTKQFSKQQRKTIVTKYKSGLGLSTVELSKQFDCSYATIRRVLKEENAYCPNTAPRNKIILSDNDKNKILVDYEAGSSANSLAKELGCNHSVIRSFLISCNIDTSGYGRGHRTSLILDRGLWRTCRALTRRIYKDHKFEINPKDLEISKYGHHIDHKLPISIGLNNDLTILDLAHPCNLQVLTALNNYYKYTKCSITKRELLDNIKTWNKGHGDPFESINMEIEYTYKYGRYKYYAGSYRYFRGYQ